MALGNQQLRAVIKDTPVEPSERPASLRIWTGEREWMPTTTSLPGACWLAIVSTDWSRRVMRVDGQEIRGEAIRAWIEEHAPVTLERARHLYAAAA